MKRVLVPLANGFEEMEAVIVVDILRRAGLEVVVAGLDGDAAIGAHGITVQCDTRLEGFDAETVDAIVLPGGMPGSRRLRDSDDVRRAVLALHRAGKLLAAVCAAPTVLEACGVLANRRATSHPAHAHEMPSCRYETAEVVEDGNVITSRGAGTSIEFAAAVARRLAGDEVARDILERIEFRRSAT